MFKIIMFVFLFISSKISFAANEWPSWWNDTTSTVEWFSFLQSLISAEIFINFLFAVWVIIWTFLFTKIVGGRLDNYFKENNKENDVTKEWVYWVITRSINIAIWFIWITLSFWVMWLDVGLFIWWIWIWLGFTMQIFLSNYIYWIIMVTQWTIRVWDMIDIWWELNKVSKVNWLFTEVKRLDGVKKFIPNIKFLQESVANLYLNETRRLDLEVSLDSKTDTTKLKLLIAKVMDNIPGVLKEPSYTIWFTWLDDNGITMKLLFRVKSKWPGFTTRSNVIETLNLAFNHAWVIVSYMDFINVTVNNEKQKTVKDDLMLLKNEMMLEKNTK